MSVKKGAKIVGKGVDKGGLVGLKPPSVFGSSYLIILLYTCVLRGEYPNICIIIHT